MPDLLIFTTTMLVFCPSYLPEFNIFPSHLCPIITKSLVLCCVCLLMLRYAPLPSDRRIRASLYRWSVITHDSPHSPHDGLCLSAAALSGSYRHCGSAEALLWLVWDGEVGYLSARWTARADRLADEASNFQVSCFRHNLRGFVSGTCCTCRVVFLTNDTSSALVQAHTGSCCIRYKQNRKNRDEADRAIVFKYYLFI